ncbi:peptidoglycan DD-metalloendopeptidase family protein [Terrimonas ferruginea]|uniref:peptidoglycan DD-metalloendopeptidase family protein n=1 Tax=Terrimonas ferruginea TaxID=249 RepID=UPI0004920756|nr:peptidoglycan DD-metalloendopeptidase family protein [Terrimonas ferruginea]
MTRQIMLTLGISVVLFFTFPTVYGQSKKTLELPVRNGIVVSTTPYLYANEERGIYIKWTTDSLVRTCDGGSVIHILNKSDSTFNVTVGEKGGRSITYYNLSSISVIKGQSLKKGAVLGFLSKNSSLFIRAQNKRGPITPQTVLVYTSE